MVGVEIVTRLKQLIDSDQINLTDVAKILEISRTTLYSYLENPGKVTLKMLESMSRLLNTQPAQIVNPQSAHDDLNIKYIELKKTNEALHDEIKRLYSLIVASE